MTPSKKNKPNRGRRRENRLNALAYRLATSITGLMPFGMRSAVTGRLLQVVFMLASGQRRRLRESISKVLPELSDKEIANIQRRVALNFGRTFVEIMHSRDLKKRGAHFHVSGPGFEALLQAQARGRGAIIVGGHFGQWEAVRISMFDAGMECGALNRPQKKQAFDVDYVNVIRHIGEPVIERGYQGMRDMIRHLRSGGFVGMALDQAIQSAPIYDFMGLPAHTVTTAPELALKLDVLIVPAYGVRRGDTSEVDVFFEDPVPHSSTQEMTELLNASLESRIRANPDQWYWWYKRWKIDSPVEQDYP